MPAGLGAVKEIDDLPRFGEPGDLVPLGSRILAGLNVRVEPVTKQLIDAGPAPAAAGLALRGLFPARV